MVNVFCIRSNDIAADFTDNLEYFVIAVLCIFEIDRCIVVLIFISIVALLEFNYSFH